MPSAREFCREPNYPVAIFLTYSFDPLFFERVPLNDLKTGGSRRIVIAADAGEVAACIDQYIGQIAHLGRRYALAETTGVGTFHPKLIARLSNTGGRVWIGSGNLTFTGWGGNRELATSWTIGPNEEDSGSWLNEVLNAVSKVARSTTFADQVREIRREVPWLTAKVAASKKSSVLIGMPGASLASQLAGRWMNRRFDELRLCTGSTDVDGAFLGWAHRTFGIKRAILYLNPAYSSFDPMRLAKLPFDVSIIAAANEQRLHAKFYWFSGPDGNAAVVGSANCSAAAWLANNVELVVAYDDATSTDFFAILTIFDEPAHSPSVALSNRLSPSNSSTENGPSHRLVSLRIRSGGLIEAIIEPELSTDAKTNVIIDSDGEALTVKIRPQGGKLVGVLPRNFQPGSMTLFAYAEGSCSGISFRTNSRWIDNDAFLERTARSPANDKSLESLSSQSLAGMDRQRILEAVQSVAARLLDHRASGNSSNSSPLHSIRVANSDLPHAPQASQTAPPTDPATLIRSINDLRRGSSPMLGSHSVGYSGALNGVIAMLFRQVEMEEIDLTRETWSAVEPEKFDLDSELAPTTSPTTSASRSPRLDVVIDRESRSTFRREIDQFLCELVNPRFAEKCTPGRLVEALAFPLLLCIRGREGGWLQSNDLAIVATRIVNIMLHESYERGKPRGLLYVVRHRYESLGGLDEFQNALSDGTLWIVLLAALRIDPSSGNKIVLPQASAISDVFQSKELLANPNTARLAQLISDLLIQGAEFQITENTERIVAANDKLRDSLLSNWESLNRAQGKGEQLRTANTLLWSPNWGWDVTPSVPAQGYHPGYIDFDVAAVRNGEIAENLKLLLNACCESRSSSESEGQESQGEFTQPIVAPS